METYNEIADRYLAAWNETDLKGRRRFIAETFTEDATYVDPLMEGIGHEGLEALIVGVQAQFPGYRFTRIGVKGTDCCTVRDGRFVTVVGFLDQMPG
ncbi:nuclear transport factor 2 family protein [bacterium]|nr:MAG: nuclear transport factor 2 family protein [bacterium]